MKRAREFLPDAFLLSGGLVLVVGLYWLFETKRVYLFPSSYKIDKVSVPLPEFTSLGAKGEKFSSADIKKPTVLIFWASWCQFCQQELPKVEEFRKQYPKVRFAGIVFRDTPENISNFIKLGEIGFESYFVEKGVAKEFGVDSVPQFFLVDSGRRIILRFRGTKFTESVEVMRALKRISQ
ncbi:MAG: TlpA family protein disulfide reductase [bacterium]